MAAKTRWGLAYPLGTVVIFLGLWQLLVALLDIPEYLLPLPSSVITELYARMNILYSHAFVTFYEVILGFLLSVGLGVPCAILIVWSKTLEKSLMPLLVFSQTIPKIAIAPLFIIWLGFGVLPKVVMSFLISFFPILIATAAGLNSVETDMLDLIKSMAAKKWQIFVKIRIPSALPYFFSGAKISTVFAIVGAIVGEFVGADKGLGYVILVGNSNLDSKLIFAAVALLSLFGAALFYSMAKLEKLLLPWHIAVRGETPTLSM